MTQPKHYTCAKINRINKTTETASLPKYLQNALHIYIYTHAQGLFCFF
uniref:Uncharacterized protein n=1 Tax=Anguilla anguilla TaxID=7936 RepID=A0A0E9QXT7_ANGAN